MPITQFPDPRDATEDGIVALGGDLHPESLLLAYKNGIFPWPIKGLPLSWFCPDPRAILRFDELHIPKSLTKARRQSGLAFTWDCAFSQVIEACASSPRPGQPGTWITPPMLRAYLRFHKLGHAHSLEAWRDSKLVGGIYGVLVENIFSAESMFHTEDNASKLCILELVERLRSMGLSWIDIQVMTPHMAKFGAREVPRNEFLRMIGR